MTPLMDAAMFNQREVVEHLIEFGVKIDVTNKQGQRAIDLTKDVAIIEMLERRAIQMKLKGIEASSPPTEEARPKSKDGKVFRVRVEQLPLQLTAPTLEKEVKSIMRRAGAASQKTKVHICTDPITECPRGYGYIDFGDAGSADLALHGDGDSIAGCEIRVFKDTTVLPYLEIDSPGKLKDTRKILKPGHYYETKKRVIKDTE